MDGMMESVGRTPLVRLGRISPEREVWLKVEGGNPTGSYKDRMAIRRIGRALERGELRPGMRVIEYTGGSTGTALAFACAAAGLGFTAVFSDAFSASKRLAMEAFGAEVLIEPSDGTITPELIARMKARAYALAEAPDAFYADQFGAADVREGYRPMGREIAEALPRAAAFCAAVGTGAALMGAADGMAEAGLRPALHAVEPAQSPLLTTGRGGPHRVEGVGVGFEPPFLDRARLSGVMAVDEEEGFEMTRRLAREEGVLAGASTGLNVVAALRLAEEAGGPVVTLGCDSGLKYLGGHVFGS